MADPLSDFSKILELQEIKKLYDELHERTVRTSRSATRRSSACGPSSSTSCLRRRPARPKTLRAEVDRLTKQSQQMRQEYEAKIERMNARHERAPCSRARPPARRRPRPWEGWLLPALDGPGSRRAPCAAIVDASASIPVAASSHASPGSPRNQVRCLFA